MCEAYRDQYGSNFISAMPTNLYGPNDNYNLENSHVLPALIRKFHEAKVQNKSSVTMWGTGTPMREFLHVDDLASACYFLMQNYNEKQFVNVGSSSEIAIKDLAHIIKKVIDFKGEIVHDLDKPDGTPRKLMDNEIIRSFGWEPKIGLEEGIRSTYENLKDQDWY